MANLWRLKAAESRLHKERYTGKNCCKVAPNSMDNADLGSGSSKQEEGDTRTTIKVISCSTKYKIKSLALVANDMAGIVQTQTLNKTCRI